MHKMHFDQKRFPKPEINYVCWIDIMGASPIMSRSLITATTFISKLHVVALKHQPAKMTLYPMMDGIYAVIGNKKGLEDFLKNVFRELADNFLAEKDHFYKFIVKASVAIGPVIQGKDITDSNSDKLKDDYKKSLLFGLPMIQSFKDEKKSPPFGVFIHQSARAFSPNKETPYTVRWWMWYYNYYDKIFDYANYSDLKQKLNDYFDWHLKRYHAVEYTEEKIKIHKEMSKQYFEYFD